MKKIFYSILLSGMMVLSACDALDLSPEDYYGSNDFWNQKSQVEMFMTGIHADLRDKYQMPVTLGEFRSEILISDVTSMGEGVYGPPMTNNLLTKDNTGIDDWYEVYPNIMHINLFIRNVDKEIDYLTGTEKSFYLGQAYGLRAYYYFYLYRTFGGVPLETEPKVTEGSIDITQLYKARSTPEETLEFIKEDINKSEAFFNESDKKMSNQYEWSYHATELLKAKIYMWSAKVTTGLPDDDIAGDHIATLTAVDPNNSDLLTAKKALLNLVNQQFELLPNFADLWTPEGKKNKEIIFALCFNKNELTNWGANWFYNVALFTNATDLDGNKYGPDPLKLLTAGPLRYEYKVPFIEIYDKEDTRLDATFFQYMFEGRTRQQAPRAARSGGSPQSRAQPRLRRSGPPEAQRGRRRSLHRQPFRSFFPHQRAGQRHRSGEGRSRGLDAYRAEYPGRLRSRRRGRERQCGSAPLGYAARV